MWKPAGRTEESHLLYENYLCVDPFWIIHFLFSTVFSSLLHNNEKEMSLTYGFRTGTECGGSQKKKALKGIWDMSVWNMLQMFVPPSQSSQVTFQWLSVYQHVFDKMAKCRCNLPVCIFTHGIEPKDTAFNLILGFTGTHKNQGSCKRRETCSRQKCIHPLAYRISCFTK